MARTPPSLRSALPRSARRFGSTRRGRPRAPRPDPPNRPSRRPHRSLQPLSLLRLRSRHFPRHSLRYSLRTTPPSTAPRVFAESSRPRSLDHFRALLADAAMPPALLRRNITFEECRASLRRDLSGPSYRPTALAETRTSSRKSRGHRCGMATFSALTTAPTSAYEPTFTSRRGSNRGCQLHARSSRSKPDGNTGGKPDG
jgi:hypothetical protein